MNKQKFKLIKDLMSLTIVTEILGFVGLIIYKLAEDLQLEKTKEFGCLTWLLALTFTTLSCVFIIIQYYKEKNKKITTQKDFQMNLTGLENKWNNLDQNTQCGIYAKVYKFIEKELTKNEENNKHRQ